MAERGLLIREQCPEAPRGAVVVLTEAGRAAIAMATPRRIAHIRHWLIDPLTADQLDVLADISHTVLERLRAPGSGHDQEASGDHPSCG
ncbi:hypothetical protein AB0395_29795 [Streptosporangium sp. NPDC051023]|uniref:hypothetical protein n=1 Tax=Streptosporangium sp. NPDC051023 TaxID=3155410 RepID=UPI00344E2F2B